MKRSFQRGVIRWKTMILYLVLITSCSPALASSSKTPGIFFAKGKHHTTFKFFKVANLIIIPVTLEGVTVNLILDTGMSSILLFHKTSMPHLVLENKNTIAFSGLGGNKPVKGIRVDNLALEMPGIEGQGLSIVVLKSTQIPKVINNVRIDGVFGYQLFTRFIVKIDYKNQLITMTDPSDFKRPLQASAIPIEIRNAKPYVLALVTIDEISRPMNLLVDTGASAYLMISKKLNSSQPLGKQSRIPLGIGMGGILRGRSVMVNNFRLGNIQISKDFKAQLPNEKSYPASDGSFERDGTLGGGILNQFIVTFDYFNGLMYIDSPHNERNRVNTVATISVGG